MKTETAQLTQLNIAEHWRCSLSLANTAEHCQALLINCWIQLNTVEHWWTHQMMTGGLVTWNWSFLSCAWAEQSNETTICDHATLDWSAPPPPRPSSRYIYHFTLYTTTVFYIDYIPKFYRRCRWHQWYRFIREYLPEVKTKFLPVPIEYSEARGHWFMKKSWSKKSRVRLPLKHFALHIPHAL